MVTAPDKRTLVAAIAVVIAALLACKKKDEEETPPVPSASAEPVAAAPDRAAPEPEKKEEEGPALGEVTRYKDKEKEVEGVVKVLEKEVKVFNETDEESEHVATLNKDIFVNRLATVGDDWVLVEFPSGVGELSPGWVEAKFLSDKPLGVTEEKVKTQTPVAVVKKTVTEDKKAEEKTDDKKAEEKTDDKKAEEKTDDKKAEEKKTEEKKTDTKKDDNKIAAPKVTETKKKRRKKKAAEEKKE